MVNDDRKLAINTVSGFKRWLVPGIYNNPKRMADGNWQLIEEPLSEPITPVAVNMPTPAPPKPAKNTATKPTKINA